MRNRDLAEAALRASTPVFTHGDLQCDHVFVDGYEVSGVLDWSEAGQGDAMFDLAILTLGHPEHLVDVIAGHGAGIDLDVVRASWSLRSLTGHPLADRSRLRPVLIRDARSTCSDLRGEEQNAPDACDRFGNRTPPEASLITC